MDPWWLSLVGSTRVASLALVYPLLPIATLGLDATGAAIIVAQRRPAAQQPGTERHRLGAGQHRASR